MCANAPVVVSHAHGQHCPSKKYLRNNRNARRFPSLIRRMKFATRNNNHNSNIMAKPVTGCHDTYRAFLEEFARNVDPTDQLPVRVPNFVLTPDEITGSIIDWSVQYLNDK